MLPVHQQLARLPLHELEALAHVLDTGRLGLRPSERILVRLLDREQQRPVRSERGRKVAQRPPEDMESIADVLIGARRRRHLLQLVAHEK